MAVAVQVDESNGGAETVTVGILTSNYGQTDAPSLEDTNAVLLPATSSIQKWQRLSLTDLGGAVGISKLRYYTLSSPGPEASHYFNGSIDEAIYTSPNHRKTVYAGPPTTSQTPVPETVPVGDPESANIGFGGSLAGVLAAVGRSDYIVSQLRLTSLRTATVLLTIVFDFDTLA